MGEEEILEVEQTRSLAAPFVFFIVFAFQFATKRLQDLKRVANSFNVINGSIQNLLRKCSFVGEIKQLLKEAASYSQPSTFAQAVKLRRMAAANDKELANYQAHLTQEVKQSYDLYLKVLFIAKVLIHIVLVLWYWSSPVASVSEYLVQPFGRLLTWTIWGFQATMSGLGSYPGWYCVLRLASLLVDSAE